MVSLTSGVEQTLAANGAGAGGQSSARTNTVCLPSNTPPRNRDDLEIQHPAVEQPIPQVVFVAVALLIADLLSHRLCRIARPLAARHLVAPSQL